MVRTYGSGFPDSGNSNYLYMLNTEKEGPADLFC